MMAENYIKIIRQELFDLIRKVANNVFRQNLSPGGKE